MKEAHQVHLIQHQFDNSCRDCLMVKVRALNPEWRRVSVAGGYSTPDSSLMKTVLREYLEMKTPTSDPDKGHKSAFELLGYPVQEIELSPEEGMPFENLPGTPTEPYRTGQVNLNYAGDDNQIPPARITRRFRHSIRRVLENLKWLREVTTL